MWLYNFGLTIYALILRIIAYRHPKAKLWIDGRKDIFKRMKEAIDPSDRIVWIHVASLGEFEQGRPVIEQIKREHPEYKILLTFFSPSGYEIHKNYKGADYIFYLPLDLPSNARRFLDIAHPEIAILVKYEFWLNLLAELRRRKIRTYIISAIFRRNSIFFKPYGGLWRQALDSFDSLFVQNMESQKLLGELGYDNVVVAGDTRFDRVMHIAANAKKMEIVENFKGEKRLFVAGSTWSPDEELLVELINENPDIKFVVAPHEIDNVRISALISKCTGGAIRYTDTSLQTDFNTTQVLILNTIGQLSSLYQYASMAYIGGGFGVGIHNTLEAATFGLPMAFGPNYHKFKEARDLITLDATASITSYEELKQWFDSLINDDELLKKRSHTAKDYTRKHQGSTAIIVKTLFRNSEK